MFAWIVKSPVVFLFWIAAAVFSCLAKGAVEPVRPVVVVSIEPLRLIAHELLGDKARIVTLLPKGANPHQYALKISDLVKLQSASIVLWNGPILEPFLVASLNKITAQQLSFEGMQGEAVALEEHDELDHAESSHNSSHMWLSPSKSLQMSTALAKALPGLELDAELAKINKRHVSYLEQWHELLAPLQEKGFAVYHDGYQHLVEEFTLNQMAAISKGEGKRLSLGKRLRLQRDLVGKAACLVGEPYSEAESAKDLASAMALPMIWLDPLAVNFSGDNYYLWMDELVKSLARCSQ